VRLRRPRADPTDRATDPPADPTRDGPWLVVGLGNPGRGYANTRHNVGYLVVELLAARIGVAWKRHRTGRADTAEGRLGTPGAGATPRVVLARPRAYMNEAGGAVAGVAAYASIGPEHMVAVHDELDLDRGRLRVKFGGGDNGHNGLRSMRKSLGTGDFYRVRVGIGRPPGRQDPADYVLSAWSGAERADRDVVVERAVAAVQTMILSGLEVTQSEFNN